MDKSPEISACLKQNLSEKIPFSGSSTQDNFYDLLRNSRYGYGAWPAMHCVSRRYVSFFARDAVVNPNRKMPSWGLI
jgi:hypothetical protein